MVSIVQVVFLIDVNHFDILCTNEEELEAYKSKLYLCCLRQLTEFGAQPNKGNENVRWAFKFYDSKRYKPDTTQKTFLDFNKVSVDNFLKELECTVKKSLIKKSSNIFNTSPNISHDGDNSCFKNDENRNVQFNNDCSYLTRSTREFNVKKLNDKPCLNKNVELSNIKDVECNPSQKNLPYHCHSYILNKALQEILLDYNWDIPDISSPVRTAKSKIAQNEKLGQGSNFKVARTKGNKIDNEEFNFVITFTHVPQTLKDVLTFCGKGSTAACTPSVFFSSIFDQATFNGFKEEKKLRFHLINVDRGKIDSNLRTSFQADFNKLLGGIHEIDNLVQHKSFKEVSFNLIGTSESASEISTKSITKDGFNSCDGFFPNDEVPVKGIELGINASHWWRKKKAPVRCRAPQIGPVLVWEDDQGLSFLEIPLELLAIQGSSSKQWGNISVCGVLRGNSMSLLGIGLHSAQLYVCHAPNTAFPVLLSVLLEQNLVMILRLTCGGLAGLAPWVGGVGCLVVFTTSDLSFPMDQTISKKDKLTFNDNQNLLTFLASAVEKSLKRAPAVKEKKSLPSLCKMNPQLLKSWFPSAPAQQEKLPNRSQSHHSNIQQSMMERLQKKYRPQMPRPLSGTHLPPPVLIDATQPTAAAAVPNSPFIISKANVSRAQQLVKKSKIVTAQMRVKEQQAVKQEKQAASKRKQAEERNRAMKSEALVSKTLKNINDPQDKDELATSLINLRNSSNDKLNETSSNSVTSNEDLYATAQTIITTALKHIKANFSPVSIETDLQDVLSRGIIMSAQQVGCTYAGDVQVHQLKMQVLLHLEVMFVLGFSSKGPSTDGAESSINGQRGEIREHYVEEILKLLRTMSLRHNPSIMTEFLQQSVIQNYQEFLGETLVEIYEELNQPVPESLLTFVDADELQSPLKPLSIKSQTNSITSNGPNSEDLAVIGPTKEGGKSLRPLLRREPSNRQIIVPCVKRPLRKINSSSNVADKGKKDVKQVCRNLFDKTMSKTSPKLKRSYTVANIGCSSKSAISNKTHSKYIPKGENKESRKRLVPVHRRSYPITPLRQSGRSDTKTPTPKKGKILVPETPVHNISTTIYNRLRLHKSTGSTVIVESPDVKGTSKTTVQSAKASLSLTRRRSFYSGARSRNFEKGKQQLMASHIKGLVDRKSSLSNTSSNDSSFLFSEIIQSIHRSEGRKETIIGDQSKAKEKIPECKKLEFGFDDASTSQQSDIGSAESDHFKRTPVKNVKRLLKLSTPVKSCLTSVESSMETSVQFPDSKPCTSFANGARNKFSQTPSKNSSLNIICKEYSDCMTPSKRVQFNFNHTPSKPKLLPGTSLTPKSILKTPIKTPSKTPSKTPLKFINKSISKSLMENLCESPSKQIKPPMEYKLIPVPKKVVKMAFTEVAKPYKFNEMVDGTKGPFNITVAKFHSETQPSQIEALLSSPINSLIHTPRPLKIKSIKILKHSFANETCHSLEPVETHNQPFNSPSKPSVGSPPISSLLSPFKSPLKSFEYPQIPPLKSPFKSPIKSPISFANSPSKCAINYMIKLIESPTKELLIEASEFASPSKMKKNNSKKKLIYDPSFHSSTHLPNSLVCDSAFKTREVETDQNDRTETSSDQYYSVHSPIRKEEDDVWKTNGKVLDQCNVNNFPSKELTENPDGVRSPSNNRELNPVYASSEDKICLKLDAFENKIDQFEFRVLNMEETLVERQDLDQLETQNVNQVKMVEAAQVEMGEAKQIICEEINQAETRDMKNLENNVETLQGKQLETPVEKLSLNLIHNNVPESRVMNKTSVEAEEIDAINEMNYASNYKMWKDDLYLMDSLLNDTEPYNDEYQSSDSYLSSKDFSFVDSGISIPNSDDRKEEMEGIESNIGKDNSDNNMEEDNSENNMGEDSSERNMGDKINKLINSLFVQQETLSFCKSELIYENKIESQIEPFNFDETKSRKSTSESAKVATELNSRNLTIGDTTKDSLASSSTVNNYSKDDTNITDATPFCPTSSCSCTFSVCDICLPSKKTSNVIEGISLHEGLSQEDSFSGIEDEEGINLSPEFPLSPEIPLSLEFKNYIIREKAKRKAKSEIESLNISTCKENNIQEDVDVVRSPVKERIKAPPHEDKTFSEDYINNENGSSIILKEDDRKEQYAEDQKDQLFEFIESNLILTVTKPPSAIDCVEPPTNVASCSNVNIEETCSAVKVFKGEENDQYSASPRKLSFDVEFANGKEFACHPAADENRNKESQGKEFSCSTVNELSNFSNLHCQGEVLTCSTVDEVSNRLIEEKKLPLSTVDEVSNRHCQGKKLPCSTSGDVFNSKDKNTMRQLLYNFMDDNLKFETTKNKSVDSRSSCVNLPDSAHYNDVQDTPKVVIISEKKIAPLVDMVTADAESEIVKMDIRQSSCDESSVEEIKNAICDSELNVCKDQISINDNSKLETLAPVDSGIAINSPRINEASNYVNEDASRPINFVYKTPEPSTKKRKRKHNGQTPDALLHSAKKSNWIGDKYYEISPWKEKEEYKTPQTTPKIIKSAIKRSKKKSEPISAKKLKRETPKISKGKHDVSSDNYSPFGNSKSNYERRFSDSFEIISPRKYKKEEALDVSSVTDDNSLTHPNVDTEDPESKRSPILLRIRRKTKKKKETGVVPRPTRESKTIALRNIEQSELYDDLGDFDDS